jgi:hypothetical protein
MGYHIIRDVIKITLLKKICFFVCMHVHVSCSSFSSIFDSFTAYHLLAPNSLAA